MYNHEFHIDATDNWWRSAINAKCQNKDFLNPDNNCRLIVDGVMIVDDQINEKIDELSFAMNSIKMDEEKMKLAEEKRLAEEQRIAEERKIAEEKRLA